jgi:transposase
VGVNVVVVISWRGSCGCGGMLPEVSEDPQTCSECGRLPSSRPRGIAGLGIREWTCDDCGAVHDRDVNAAKNILRCGLTALAEGTSTSRLRPTNLRDAHRPSITTAASPVNFSGPIKTARDK